MNLYLTAGDAVLVGRSRVCDVHLDDDQVSGKHCRLQFDGETVHVTDLDSTNGVLVNGNRVASAILQTHDRIGFGNVRFDANVQLASPRP